MQKRLKKVCQAGIVSLFDNKNNFITFELECKGEVGKLYVIFIRKGR